MDILKLALAQPTHLVAIAAVLLLGIVSFFVFFFVPALVVWWRLRQTLRRLQSSEYRETLELAPVFERSRILKHLWSEFRETLHEERRINTESGIQEVVALRATLPAEIFFTYATVVDAPVRAEFFKHVPGIFTGIGIIGTFWGLILGLQAFQVSEDPGIVRDSLNALLHTVGDAFIVSASAIAFAMVATAVEKLILVGLYGKVEKLTQNLDARFTAGLGEEYLSRLVNASEESASQSRILKDALVGDLKKILTDLTEQQIAATNQGHVQLGQQITTSIGDGLKAPLEKIAAAVNQVGQEQSSAVHQLIGDVLASFSQRLEDLFGDQMTGMHQMQQQTVNALQVAIGKLESMAGAVEGAGKNATQAMAEQMADSLSKLESRQKVMNEEMRKFVNELRETVQKTQAETSTHLSTALQDLANQATSLVGALSSQSGAHLQTMGTQVDGVVKAVGAASAQMAGTVSRLESMTDDSIVRMNSSAETLAVAADDFAKAGRGVSDTLGRTESLAEQLMQSATGIGQASVALESILKDYRSTRDAVSQMLTTVKEIVEAARREATLTTDIVHRIEHSATKLAEAQKSADEYLDSVNAVLEEVHSDFAAGMRKTLGTANDEFYKALSQATKLLRESIIELESTIDLIGVRSTAGG